MGFEQIHLPDIAISSISKEIKTAKKEENREEEESFISRFLSEFVFDSSFDFLRHKAEVEESPVVEDEPPVDENEIINVMFMIELNCRLENKPVFWFGKEEESKYVPPSRHERRRRPRYTQLFDAKADKEL